MENKINDELNEKNKLIEEDKNYIYNLKNEILKSKEEMFKVKEEMFKVKEEMIKVKEELKEKEEIIKSKDEIIKQNEQLIKLKEEKIKFLEKNIKDNKNNEINDIIEFINPKVIKIKYNQKEYNLICHRWYDEDKINGENTKLSIHSFKTSGGKFFLLRDKQGLYTIIYDQDFDGMLNWKLFSDGNNVYFNKEFNSKFQLIPINGMKDHYYIVDHNSGKFLCNSKKRRDFCSYYIELSDFDNLIEREKFIFYFEF